MGKTSFPYNVGDRVGQIFFEPVIPISFEVVPELDQSDRGEGGFGSTGIK
jgi:dUTP pyrophosphatase